MLQKQALLECVEETERENAISEFDRLRSVESASCTGYVLS